MIDDAEEVLSPGEGQDQEVQEQVQDEDQPGEQDAEGDVEGSPEQQPVEGQQPVHQKQNANQRIQQEITRRKGVEAELARYRDHVLEMQRQTQQPAPRLPSEDPEAVRRQLENMGDVERILWLQQEQERKAAVREQHMNLQLHIQTDRLAFDRILTTNPQYQRYADQVETEFQKCLRNGQPRGREELLSVAIGNEVRANSAAAVAKAKKAGAARIQQQTSAPARARSGVASSGGRTTESAEDILRRRLENSEYS